MYRIASVEVTPGDIVRCLSPEGLAIHVEDRCVFETNHVLEIGKIVSVVDGAEGAAAPSEHL